MKYEKNYIKAVESPLPELARTFFAEAIYLAYNIGESNLSPATPVLDVGCGIRPLGELARTIPRLNFHGVDNNPHLIEIAKKRNSNLTNLKYELIDATQLPFQANKFGFTYSTYNTLGSMSRIEREKIISEMARVTQRDKSVVVVTWNRDKFTTAFLKEYYHAMGAELISIDDSKTILDKGTFERLSKEEIFEIYRNYGIMPFRVDKIGKLWTAFEGIKEN